MASSMLIKVTLLAVICLVLGIPLANATLSCDQIGTTLKPCQEYIKNPGPSVPAPCCDAIRTIFDADCDDLCRCSKSIIIKMPELNDPAFSAIPIDCDIKLPYDTCFGMDCD